MANQILVDMSEREKTGLISTGVSRAQGYTNHLKSWSESIKAKNPAWNHAVGFVNLMLARDKNTETYLESFVAPLKEDRKKLEEDKATATAADKILISEKISLINRDIAYTTSRMKQAGKLFLESALGGMLKPNQQLTLPLQYLETIQNNSRLVVPFDTCEARTMIRQRVLRQITVDGVKHTLPDAYKDAALMRKILNTDTKKRTLNITNAKRTWDLLAMFNTDAVAGMDKLNPLATFTYIYVDDGAKMPDGTTVKPTKIGIPLNHNEAVLTWRLRGKFNFTVKHPTLDVLYQVAGGINFETGMLDILLSDNILSADLEVSLAGGNFPKTFTPTEVREDKDFVVDNQISAQFTWNPVDLQDKLTLENIDALMSATSTIYETATHLKDFYVFEELRTWWGLLKTDRMITGNYNYHQQYEYDVKMYPDAASNMQYMATDPVSWRNKTLGEGISILATSYGTKLNSREGFTSVFWGHPQTIRYYGDVNLVLEEGSEYGGVKMDASVLSGQVKGKNVRLVETQRAPESEMDTDGTTVLKYLPSIVLSNAPNEETFKFWQWMTYFDQQGQIRNPNDLVHPTISYLDFFKLDMVHGIMGRLNLNNHDKYIG